MSGLVLMKYPSLLKFDQDSHSDLTVKSNFQNLYNVIDGSPDTTFRETFDVIDPRQLQNQLYN